MSSLTVHKYYQYLAKNETMLCIFTQNERIHHCLVLQITLSGHLQKAFVSERIKY
jgi:hypothetical protein